MWQFLSGKMWLTGNISCFTLMMMVYWYKKYSIPVLENKMVVFIITGKLKFYMNKLYRKLNNIHIQPLIFHVIMAQQNFSGFWFLENIWTATTWCLASPGLFKTDVTPAKRLVLKIKTSKHNNWSLMNEK